MPSWKGGRKATRDRHRSTERGQRMEWFHNLKYYAKKRGIEWDITIDDIKVPRLCPVLGMKLERGVGVAHDSSPTLDRIDNTKGYTKKNVRVISKRANVLKSNGALEEFIAITLYMAREIGNERQTSID